MNIRNLPDSLQPAGIRGKTKASTETGSVSVSSDASPVGSVDKVALSSTSRQLQRAENGGVGVNTEKVEMLKKAVAEGTYSVNSNAIADSLIAHQLDLMKAAAPKN